MGFFDGRSILVTGGAGFIGHELVRQLLDRGATVRATVYRERQLDLTHPRLEMIPCDLMRPEDCAKVVRGMDMVLHAAAYVRGIKGQRTGQHDVVMTNLRLGLNVAEASARAGVERVGWISSSTVYPDTDHPFTEDEAFEGNPPDGYFGIGWVKRYGEKLCQFFHRTTNTRFAIVRSGAIYGPYERFDVEAGHVLPALIVKAARRLDPFPVWGDGQEVRDFVYVADFVEGFLLAVERHATADPINIATGVGSSVNEALRIILEHEGYRPTIQYQPDQPSASKVRRLDVNKARRLLGFTAATPLRTGVLKTIEWYKAVLAQGSHTQPSR